MPSHTQGLDIFSSITFGSKFALRALEIGLFLIIAACSSAAPTPIPPTATSTPTTTPIPTPDPVINLNGDSLFSDLVKLVPQKSVRCMNDELGGLGYDKLLQQPLFNEGLQLDRDFPVHCLTTDVLVSVLIAALSVSADGLSDSTVICIKETFAGLDVPGFAALTRGEVDRTSLSGATGATVGLLLCLSNDEAEKITAERVFGDVGGASTLSMADLRCVLEVVDAKALVELLATIENDRTFDFDTGLGLLTAISECDIDIHAFVSEASDKDVVTNSADTSAMTSNLGAQ